MSRATQTLPIAQLGDDDPAGSRHLREVVTAYHRRVRSGCAAAEDAVVVGGFRQGVAFALAALARHGIRRIALEDPGPREHDVIARRAGLEAVPVPVDDQGLNVGRLRETGARAVLLTPAHQCPTGVALGPSRRRELVAWADEVDGVILEDDYDAEFRYDRQPVGSLQGLNPARVIALGSVSKTLAPAIRLGWVLAPPRFVAGIVEEKRLSSRGAPGLDQEALALLMETGRFDRHLRRVREIYRARRDVLAAEAELAFGPGRLHGLAAGCHALLRLPDGTSERAVAATAATMGVRVNTRASTVWPRTAEPDRSRPPSCSASATSASIRSAGASAPSPKLSDARTRPETVRWLASCRRASARCCSFGWSSPGRDRRCRASPSRSGSPCRGRPARSRRRARTSHRRCPS